MWGQWEGGGGGDASINTCLIWREGRKQQIDSGSFAARKEGQMTKREEINPSVILLLFSYTNDKKRTVHKN